MATQQKENLCGVLVSQLVSGGGLTPEEKTHLAECEGCMGEVVRQLDESQRNRSAESASVGSENLTSHPRDGAQRALEHGRKVFEREFRVSVSK